MALVVGQAKSDQFQDLASGDTDFSGGVHGVAEAPSGILTVAVGCHEQMIPHLPTKDPGVSFCMSDTRAPVPGWTALKNVDLPALITIRNIMDITGLSRETIREWLKLYRIEMIDRRGSHWSNRYDSWQVVDMTTKMAGRGRSVKKMDTR